jgi:transposase-like protein
MDGVLSNMEKVLEAKKIFERERKSMKTRALGVILYHFGISLRNTSLVVSSFEQASHEAVRDWYLRAAKIFQVRKIERKIIAIDETKIKINGKWRILWAAIDIENWDVLGVWVSPRGDLPLKPTASSGMFSIAVRTNRKFSSMVDHGIHQL